jgi:hypothetical protein
MLQGNHVYQLSSDMFNMGKLYSLKRMEMLNLIEEGFYSIAHV